MYNITVSGIICRRKENVFDGAIYVRSHEVTLNRFQTMFVEARSNLPQHTLCNRAARSIVMFFFVVQGFLIVLAFWGGLLFIVAFLCGRTFLEPLIPIKRLNSDKAYIVI